MARLTVEQWEQARAEYEVRGGSLQQVADMFKVSRPVVSRRAKKEGWEQGRASHIVNNKVTAIKKYAEAQTESQALAVATQHTIDSVVSERLRAEGLLASFDVALLQKGMSILESVTDPGQWATMTQGRRNLAPAERANTTVNVSANAASLPCPSPQPTEAIRKALRGDFIGDD